MRHVFLCALLCLLSIPAGRTQPRQTQAPNLSTTAAAVNDWADRLTSGDPNVRALAEAALVDGAARSLPLLRRFLARPDGDLDVVTFEVLRRLGPAAIPML